MNTGRRTHIMKGTRLGRQDALFVHELSSVPYLHCIGLASAIRRQLRWIVDSLMQHTLKAGWLTPR